MKKGIFQIFFSILLSFIVSCGGGKAVKKDSSHKNPNKGQATGYATIYDGDKSLARDRATDDAKSKLVRKVLGETISGRSIMKNYELVSNIVEAKSYGLVKDLEIIKQWQGGSEYYVTIEGIVEPSVVEDAIEDALNRYGRPKFMVLIKENFEGKQNNPGFTETEIISQEIMGNSGFEFVDPNMIQELMKKDKRKMAKAASGKVSEDVQDLLLDDTGAEILIIGTAQTKAQGGKLLKSYGAGSMQSRSAIIRLKAIDLYTGKILASVSRQAPGLHIEAETASKKAIEAALKKILGGNDYETGKFKAGPFMTGIIDKFVKAANNREIELFISGLDRAELKDFRNKLQQRVRGVNKVIQRGRDGRAAKLDVFFAGKTNDFEDELSAKAEKLGYEIKIKTSRPNKLIMSAKSIK